MGRSCYNKGMDLEDYEEMLDAQECEEMDTLCNYIDWEIWR